LTNIIEDEIEDSLKEKTNQKSSDTGSSLNQIIILNKNESIQISQL
jgi:hypothetical protein